MASSYVATFLICLSAATIHFAEPRKILLENLHTLTLRHGELTTSRRSSPVPQLKCVGGTAGCYAFVPQHVQCYNRGSDGYDIQWECKTEMDNKYRFGKIDVTCEGYDYADDPYVLAGSCGLEYNMDYTTNSYAGSYSNSKYNDHQQSTSFGSAIGLLFVVMIIFFVYRTCIAVDSGIHNIPHSSHENFDNNYHPNPSAPPPPYGFRPEYQQQQKQYTTGQQNGDGQPGFFSGMLAGGLLGYLFGNNRSNSYNSGYNHRYHGDLFGINDQGRSSFDNFSNLGSRTSSGFGGTKRR